MDLPKVSYGDTDAEDIDWRSQLDSNSDDDEEDLSPEDNQQLVDMLGFDPSELEDNKTLKKKLSPPPKTSFTK